MSVHTLKYFNCMGLVEPIRYILAYGNVQYDNIVISETEWIKMQKEVPFSKLPILEVDGKPLYHPVAISKYLANKTIGLMPVNDWEDAELDSIVDFMYELGLRKKSLRYTEWFVHRAKGSQVWNWQHQMNQDLKNFIYKDLVETIIPKWFADLEQILKKKGGLFGGNKLSWADIYVVGILESVEKALNKSWLPKYPQLQQVMLEVQNVPAIKTYISKRPSYKY